MDLPGPEVGIHNCDHLDTIFSYPPFLKPSKDDQNVVELNLGSLFTISCFDCPPVSHFFLTFSDFIIYLVQMTSRLMNLLLSHLHLERARMMRKVC